MICRPLISYHSSLRWCYGFFWKTTRKVAFIFVKVKSYCQAISPHPVFRIHLCMNSNGCMGKPLWLAALLLNRRDSFGSMRQGLWRWLVWKVLATQSWRSVWISRTYIEPGMVVHVCGLGASTVRWENPRKQQPVSPVYTARTSQPASLVYTARNSQPASPVYPEKSNQPASLVDRARNNKRSCLKEGRRWGLTSAHHVHTMTRTCPHSHMWMCQNMPVHTYLTHSKIQKPKTALWI